ncbi:MAG: MAPEG family protein [Xanthomonadales bacterium]
MFYKPMLLPLLAQIFLTFVVWFYLYALRIPEIRSKGIDVKDLRDRAESHRLLPVSAAASNNLKNLFEMPVLFYTAVLLTLVLLVQDPWLVALAWGFVAFRAVHSFIHCTYNNVNHRFVAYALSCLFLIFMWIRLGSFILAN